MHNTHAGWEGQRNGGSQPYGKFDGRGGDCNGKPGADREAQAGRYGGNEAGAHRCAYGGREGQRNDGLRAYGEFDGRGGD